MSKIFYNKATGDGAVFDDAASLADWPDFQADPVAASATKVRAERDELLAASDSHVWPDHVPEDWRTYRQALRDLPQAEGFPDVNFPTPPS
jgi:hypothetical protein